MSKLIRNVFISSKYRLNSNETPYDFYIYFPRGFLECEEQQIMKVNIINFHMPNTMYNINDNNNKVHIVLRNKITGDLEAENIYTITNGNYNVYELKDHLNELMGTYVNITYNKIRNTYEFLDILASETQDVYIKTPFGKYLGLADGVEYKLDTVNAVESVKPVNMVAYNKIVMNCLGLDYNIGTIENISSPDGFEISNILFWASRQDVANMAEITYNNEDGGDSFNYALFNKSVQYLHFVLTDEDYNVLTDLPDWTMILQFSIEEQAEKEIVVLSNILQQYLKDFYAMFYLLLGHFKIV